MTNKRIKGLMAEKGITHKLLAKTVLFISARSVGLKISGQRQFKQSELIRLANFFETTVDELVK